MTERPSKADLRLACEAMAALLHTEFGSRSLDTLIQIYMPPSRVDMSHLLALRKVDRWLATERDDGVGDDTL